MKKIQKMKKIKGKQAHRLISRAAKKAGVTMTAACAMQGFSRMTLNDWRRGIRDPKPESLVKIELLLKALETIAE